MKYEPVGRSHNRAPDWGTAAEVSGPFPPREGPVSAGLLPCAAGEAGRGQERGSAKGAWGRGTSGPNLGKSVEET